HARPLLWAACAARATASKARATEPSGSSGSIIGWASTSLMPAATQRCRPPATCRSVPETSGAPRTRAVYPRRASAQATAPVAGGGPHGRPLRGRADLGARGDVLALEGHGALV